MAVDDDILLITIPIVDLYDRSTLKPEYSSDDRIQAKCSFFSVNAADRDLTFGTGAA